MKKTVKKANITMLLLSVVLIVAAVCFAVLSYAWYTVSVDDVSADLNVETNSVYTFEVLRASFFMPNDVLSAPAAYATNQYPHEGPEADAENIAKFKYATLDVEYRIYNAPSEEDYIFSVAGLEIYAPGVVSVYDEPLYKVEVVKDEDGNKILNKSAEGVIVDRAVQDLTFCFAASKDADDHAEWTEDNPAVWKSIEDCSEVFSLSKSGKLYLAAAFGKYDDLIDDAIYNGLQIKIIVAMEKAPAPENA